MNFCEKCGAQLSGENFCPSCGNQIKIEDFVSDQESVNILEGEVLPAQQDIYDAENKFDIKQIPKKYFMFAIAAVVIIVAGIIIFSANSGPNFKKLYDKHCNPIWAEVGSDNSYLTIDTNPSDLEDDGLAYVSAGNAVEIINEELGLPSSLFQDMKTTSSNDGKQIEEFDEVTVSWKYHPDTGLEVMYKKK